MRLQSTPQKRNYHHPRVFVVLSLAPKWAGMSITISSIQLINNLFKCSFQYCMTKSLDSWNLKIFSSRSWSILRNCPTGVNILLFCLIQLLVHLDFCITSATWIQQEISFWLNLEQALLRIQEKVWEPWSCLDSGHLETLQQHLVPLFWLAKLKGS